MLLEAIPYTKDSLLLSLPIAGQEVMHVIFCMLHYLIPSPFAASVLRLLFNSYGFNIKLPRIFSTETSHSAFLLM